MEIAVRHETLYRYDAPLRGAAMLLRLFPVSGVGQEVRDWRLEAPGGLAYFNDHHGNRAALLTLERSSDSLRILARGRVVTADCQGTRPQEAGELPAGAYLRAGVFTQPDPTLAAFAESFRAALAKDRLAGLHALLRGVAECVAYLPGTTEVETTAAEALAAGRGVCQDQTHVFLSAARLLGVPARYISGYLADPEGRLGSGLASHAWAEALVEGLGWVSFDPANGISATEAYLRLAQGLDYKEAGPARGVRLGGGGESMTVSIEIQGQQ